MSRHGAQPRAPARAHRPRAPAHPSGPTPPVDRGCRDGATAHTLPGTLTPPAEQACAVTPGVSRQAPQPTALSHPHTPRQTGVWRHTRGCQDGGDGPHPSYRHTPIEQGCGVTPGVSRQAPQPTPPSRPHTPAEQGCGVTPAVSRQAPQPHPPATLTPPAEQGCGVTPGGVTAGRRSPYPAHSHPRRAGVRAASDRTPSSRGHNQRPARRQSNSRVTPVGNRNGDPRKVFGATDPDHVPITARSALG